MDFKDNVNDTTFDLESETAWLEMITIGDFRVWHLIAFGLGILLAIGTSLLFQNNMQPIIISLKLLCTISLFFICLYFVVIIICCCFRFRIPRTKQEIEADHQRKQIRKKFREKLKQIKNSDMTNMDLQKGKNILTRYKLYITNI